MLKRICLLVLFTSFLLNCSNDDDFVAACETVTNVSSTVVTNNSAIITWDTSSVSALYTLEYGVTGFTIGSGTTQSETDTNAVLSGLEPATTYDVYIQTICTATNVSMYSEVFTFTTDAPFVVPEFLPTLSELNLYGAESLDVLRPTTYGFQYELSTALFTDYAHKQRFMVLPQGEKLTYDGEGLPLFPDNTVIVKTFYYNNDERDLSLGRKIIETRVLIKINGSWETGDYKWNDEQTEAFLDPNGSIVPITYIDADGDTNNVNYQIPSDTDCFTCHRIGDDKTPIGPKMRTLNFNVSGLNQLQSLINSNLIDGLTDPSSVSVLPKWDDDVNYTLEERARAYFDVNCAHCHIEGGLCEVQSTLRLDYERAFADSNIQSRRNSIINRVSNYNQGFSMPLNGTTMVHDEGIALILEYLDTLE
ncbi:fibronectin type III domain-containing protein [uncultured Psychroserpens sp.]|uniref:fibronectin type III domain-containing protein n=1 Tax=uncultured Psychroserpens sp. TaxID=255436 RepID=UPI00260F4FC5|nr:fibronectin type III domain-containing protein [uncultured Psychroserpens sp.]